MNSEIEQSDARMTDREPSAFNVNGSNIDNGLSSIRSSLINPENQIDENELEEIKEEAVKFSSRKKENS